MSSKTTKSKKTAKVAKTTKSAKNTAKKETLYIEADDEITAVIDKVASADEKVVAVVLPKHASVFQSVVNMKLLKRAAKEEKKSLVLITSDPAISSIAGVAEIHIAKTLNTKPAIPKVPNTNLKETVITANDVDMDGVPVEQKDLASKDEEQEAGSEDTIELDNTEDLSVEEPPAKKVQKKLKFKIPDFSSFRLKMGLGMFAIVLLGVGWFFGFVVLPEATITINTDTSRVDVATDFIAKDGLEASDLENGVLAAKKVEVKKEDSVTVPATGEKNVGEKAKGIMTLTNCVQSASGVSVPSGSSFSAGSFTFVTNEALELGPAVYAGSNCISADFPAFGAIKDVSVTSTQSGEGANLAARSYTSSISGVSAFGSDMTGGTTKIVTVVSADDIKKAKDQITGSSTADAIEELRDKLSSEQLQPLEETLQESEAKSTQSAKEDAEVAELVMTRTVDYSMSGVSSEDVSKLLDTVVQDLLGDKTQNTRSNGLSTTSYQLAEKLSDVEYRLSLRTVATIGPEFDKESIKQEVTGKELGEVRALLEPRDGVSSVNVEFKPFWVFQIPSNTDKISIIINET